MVSGSGSGSGIRSVVSVRSLIPDPDPGSRSASQRQRRLETLERADERQRHPPRVHPARQRCSARALRPDSAPRASDRPVKKPCACVETRVSARASVLRLARLERRGRQHALAIAHQIVDAIVAERDAEVLRRHVLELMRLVHDQRRAGRESLRRTRSCAPTRRRTAGDG